MKDKQPERIWIQDGDDDIYPGDGKTWTVHLHNPQDTEYVNAVVVAELNDEIKTLYELLYSKKAGNKRLKKALSWIERLSEVHIDNSVQIYSWLKFAERVRNKARDAIALEEGE